LLINYMDIIIINIEWDRKAQRKDRKCATYAAHRQRLLRKRVCASDVTKSSAKIAPRWSLHLSGQQR
jgi:hypothetical protein